MHTTTPITEPTLSAMAFGQPMWAPEESNVPAPAPAPDAVQQAAPQNPAQVRPRGNGALHDADLARGQEQLVRVLGW
jgi:hypothetical protein